MERILSIVAQPSKDFMVAQRPHDFTKDSMDVAIDEVVKKLENAQPAGSVKRADSLKAIAEVLEADNKMNPPPEPPDVIQIIGHGAAGVLSLGFHWDQIYARGRHGPVFMLDSSPYTYGVLSGLVAPTTTVLILGCQVGAADAAPSAGFADGLTLLIDLARMFRCRVLGANEFITADHFDANTGKFIGSLVASTGETISGTPFNAPEEPTDDRVAFRKLIGVPILGQRYGKVDLEVQEGPSGQLSDAYPMWVTMRRPPLVLADLEFEVELKGSRWPGALVGNLRYLRVNAKKEDGVTDDVRWYGLAKPPLVPIRAVVDELIRQALNKAEADALRDKSTF
jgi:hypothetical protein